MQLNQLGERFTKRRNRVVIDTSILISAFAFDGISEKAVKVFNKADIYVSAQLLQEYRDTPVKLEEQGKITHQQMQALIAGIAAVVSHSRIVYPTKKLLLCRDLKGNMILECCYTSRAHILITEDKDLLDVTDLPFELRLMTPQAFNES